MFQSSVKRKYEISSAGNGPVISHTNEISGGKNNSSIVPQLTRPMSFGTISEEPQNSASLQNLLSEMIPRIGT
ncbi:hypothetical protein FHS21_005143 [Phyllobacterium trifolii]|jgi:hypothetical protein|uniref:Uncharacterized protein n=1 Tax=Phyllobacterium trifolii TaxID=300193 RepID=A0A839UFJ8_9HYPH|nr:hypothetical protein [Phyllobacterium trifolii]